MSSIFVLIFYILVGFYIHALISPNHKLYTKRSGEHNSRGTISKFFLTAIVIILVLVGITAPPSNANQAQIQEKGEPSSLQKSTITTKDVAEKKPIAFETVTEDDATLPLGTTSVLQDGIPGKKTITYTVTLTDGKETGRVVKKESITKEAVTRIVHNGTYIEPVPDCNPNYSGCVENSVYDLDCSDIGRSVVVLGYDEYGLDRDDDGYGCESY